MKANIGTTDKALRISLGLILIMTAILVSASIAIKVILIITGIIALSTSIIGICLMYRLIGITTCKFETDK